MPRPAHAPSAATHTALGTAAPFAPSALDRLVDRVQRATPLLARTSDVVLIVVAALLTVVDLAVWITDPVIQNGRLSISLAFLVPTLGAVATIAVARRPRHLAAALLMLATASLVLTIGTSVVGASLPPSLAALFALALLTTGALRRAPGRKAVVLAAFAAVAIAAEAMRPMVDTAGYLLVVCESAFAVAVGVGVYLRWSDWRRVVAADAARTEERLEIAREMHDLVGHCVTGIVVQAQAARHVAGSQPAAAAVALEQIELAGTDALAAMRRMVGSLRDDSPTAPPGTWDEVDRLIARAVERGEPVIATIDPGLRADAPTALVPSVHRIIAESLTNVRRHGRAVSLIEIGVHPSDDRLVVTVHDDGSAAPPPGQETYGIVGMRERAASLGGSLVAGPDPLGGWLVRAELPLAAPR